MRAFTSLAVAVLAGAVIAWATGLSAGDLPRTPAYLIGTAILLAIGLYGSTYAIDVASARHDRKLILTAVTVGVLVKAALIGSVVALAWQDPLFLLLGVVVAQIDPLSVAALMADERMSPRAKTILAAWSSFDDPITVILTVYVAALTLDTGRTGWASVLVGLAVNLGFALAVWLVWRATRRFAAASTVILATAAAVAVWQLWMLGLALIGLYVRPAWLSAWLPRVTRWALFVGGALVGVLLTGLASPVTIVAGITLGLAAYAAQMVVGWLLTRHLPRHDRIHLALAQQNGITAIILALRLESSSAGIAALVAPAVLAVNLTHALVNRWWDGLVSARRTRRPRRSSVL